jgi:choline dehydrogenase-like flavoprotein
MFVDARKLPAGERHEAAVCIVGAGAAGITLAREFAGTSTDVIVLESGGLSHNAATQALARGKVISDGKLGVEYSDLEVERVRFFGGATDHWGGDCRPLDPVDFLERPWVPHSGWPFGLAELAPYYRRAAPVVEIGSYEQFAIPDWEALVRARPPRSMPSFSAKTLVTPRVFQDSPPTRFGKRYRAELEGAANVKVFLNANLVGMETDAGRHEVQGVQVACLGGPKFTVKARAYVLATGTIENARLLLSEAKGFGNDSGMVGRFFQEHIAHRSVAQMLPAEQLSFTAYRAGNEHGTTAASFTDEAQREHQLPNFTIFLQPVRIGAETPAVRSFQTLVGGARAGAVPDRLWTHIRQVLSDLPTVTRYAMRRASTSDAQIGLFEIVMVLEQMPNPDSRVRLGRERDALGVPVAELEWRLTDLDRDAMLKCVDIVTREIGASGAGRAKALVPEDGQGWLDRVVHSHHPMGTTRMHVDPRRGVVDGNCRVHGMDNLYVAGASVFPTAGAASPTYSIVALAIRLADHLKRHLA